MTDTYCGKNCEECSYREELNCPGSKAGPGRALDGECNIARCCRYKNINSCMSCDKKNSCVIIGKSSVMPEQLKEGLLIKNEITEQKKKMSGFCRPVFISLFWLMLSATVLAFFNLFGDDDFRFAVNLTNYSCMTAYYILISILAKENDRYALAGLFGIVNYAVKFLELIVYRGQEVPTAFSLITFPASVIGIIGMFKEISAHSELLVGIDTELSEKWLGLRKYMIIFTIATIGSGFLAWIPPLMYIALAISVIGLIVTFIMIFIYLRKSANAFKHYAAQ